VVAFAGVALPADLMAATFTAFWPGHKVRTFCMAAFSAEAVTPVGKRQAGAALAAGFRDRFFPEKPPFRLPYSATGDPEGLPIKGVDGRHVRYLFQCAVVRSPFTVSLERQYPQVPGRGRLTKDNSSPPAYWRTLCYIPAGVRSCGHSLPAAAGNSLPNC
jgi:hypothetical protein